MKKYNFNAGPAILPAEVFAEAAQGVLDLQGIGLSVLEISHRSPEFEAIIQEATQLVRELLNLDDAYGVAFLTGGASSQFFMVPLNLLAEGSTAAYVNSGSWADKAIKEAKLYGHIDVVGSSKGDNYTYIPHQITVPAEAAYLHITSNNTIFGTQYHEWPEVAAPIVADMSSDIFSRPLPIEKFGLIYAGAQKNLGPAGVTLVIVRKELLGKTGRPTPTMLQYQTYLDNGSLYNTPPVFPIYVSLLTLRWIKAKGGLTAMAQHNQTKAELFYAELDANPLFQGSVTVKGDRSWMNPTFLATNAELEKAFLAECTAAGIEGIKGHRSVGGFRASMYNAMPLESVQLLVDLMHDFAKRKG